jgi:hypothetical protein
MTSSLLPLKARAFKESLLRRLDEGMSQLSALPVSSLALGLPPPPPAEIDPNDLAPQVEVDARLGRLLWKEHARLKEGRCFHVLSPESQLMAAVNPETGAVFIKEQVLNTGLKGWQLLRRPAAAFNAPSGYRHTTVTAVLWRFALFGAEGVRVLPAHYRSRPLTMRQLPLVSRELVPVRLVKLMQVLNRQACTWSELQAQTNLSDEQLNRDLAALYLARSLRVVEKPTH